jgi:hypothetical protein
MVVRAGAATVRRRRFHRITFTAAGVYNIGWGLYAVLDPQWFFRVSRLPLSNSPQIFATLGMVLGLYGVLYLDIARKPEHGWLPAAVGLTGKILGPLGLAWLIATGQWPVRTVVIVLTNDLIWWVPFALYLRDAWPYRLSHADESGQEPDMSNVEGAGRASEPGREE